ncbi:hypothetical protein Tco_0556177 [Tanacetum coccineum]
MIEKKEIEHEKNPHVGTLWLKGRVNKDEEYQDDGIRSVGDKLKSLSVDKALIAHDTCISKEKGVMTKRSRKWNCDIQEVSPVEIHPINSSVMEETVKSVGAKRTTRSIRKDSSSQDSQSKENVSVLPQATPPSTIQMITVENKTAPKKFIRSANNTSTSIVIAMQKEAIEEESERP